MYYYNQHSLWSFTMFLYLIINPFYVFLPGFLVVIASLFPWEFVLQVDPSGSYFSWKASAMGKNVSNAKTFLEKRSVYSLTQSEKGEERRAIRSIYS